MNGFMTWCVARTAPLLLLVLSCAPETASSSDDADGGLLPSAGGSLQNPCPAGNCPPTGSGGVGGGGGIAGTAGTASSSGGASAGTSGGGSSGGGSVIIGDGSTAYGGYIMQGSWRGFAWTAVNNPDSMITPSNFGDVTDFPLCAEGSVAAGTSNVAIVGWNINQDTAAGAAPLETTPTLEGVNVSVSNPGGSPLRVQIQGPTGESNEEDRWCAIIPGSGGFIPFDAFNTQCWPGGAGTRYAGQPIVAIMVMVPGSAGGPVSFDFCVNNLEQANEDGGTVGTGCSLVGGPGEGMGNITGDQTITVTREGRQYVVQNNVWNGATDNQTLSVNGVAFAVTEQGNGIGQTGDPVSYPSVFIGSNFGRSTSASGLPKQVSSLTTVPTGWQWSAAGGSFNAAYDVWFSTNPGGDYGNPSGGYLMVWFHDPPDAQPLGEPRGPTRIADTTWDVWVCNQQNDCDQNGVPVISYVATATIPALSFDLNDFIKNAVNSWPGTIQNSWYLSNIFAGFEIWNGGLGLRTENFCAIVN